MTTLGRLAFSTAALGALALTLPAMRSKPKRTLPFADSRLRIEVNSTAGDAGIQANIDSEEPWDSVVIEDPNGHRIFDVKGKGNLGKLGSTELFFESEEPSFDEQPLEETLKLFPEGTWQFTGTTVGGDKLTGTAVFTHMIPDGPVIVSPVNGSTQNPAHMVIDWNPVTSPPGIQIAKYEVIVEQADFEPPRTFDLFVPASVTSVTVSPEFFESGQNYNLEVLAIEVGGNQTITEGHFVSQ